MQPSELQVAAGDVRDIQAAIEKFEGARVECQNGVSEAQAEVTRAQIVLAQELRQLADTNDLLNAQRNKLYRELERVRMLTYQGQEGEKTQAVVCQARAVNHAGTEGRPAY